MKKVNRALTLFLAWVMLLSPIESMASDKIEYTEAEPSAEVQQVDDGDSAAASEESSAAEEPDSSVEIAAPAETQEPAGEEPVEPEEPEEPEEPTEEEPQENVDLTEITVDAVVEAAALYDQWKNPTEPLSGVQRFLEELYGREATLRKDDGSARAVPLKLSVRGNLPEGVTAKLRYIEFDEEAVYSETALFGVDLSLYDAEGELYLPETPVTVTVSGPTVNSAIRDDSPMLVYIYEENTQREAAARVSYALDTQVYRDRFGKDQRRAYEVYDNDGNPIRFKEDRKGLTVYGNNTFTFEYDWTKKADAEAPLRFLIARQLSERILYGGAGDTAVAVYGAFADSVSVEVSSAAERSEEALLAVDISMAEEDAGSFQPDTPMAVAISDDLIAEAQTDGMGVALWQIGADGGSELVEDAVVWDSYVYFETDALTEYQVVRTVLEKELTASDGNEYLVTVSYDSNSGIPENAELIVSEIKEGDKGYDEYVAESAETLDISAETVSFARAFDITLKDPETGEEYQPTKDVKVSIELLPNNLDESASVEVVHFGQKTEIMDATVNGETVEFETSGFSVYVVIAHEGGEIKTPRVEFHFLDSEYSEYPEYPVPEDGKIKYTAGPYSFLNKGGTMQTSQILKDGETLELITNPPNKPDGSEKYFFGWYLVNDKGTDAEGKRIYEWTEDPEQIFPEKEMTISDIVWNSDKTAITSLVWEMNGVKHTVTASENDSSTNHIVLDEYGVAHVYLAPVYEDYYFISYHLGPSESDLSNSLYTRRLVVLGSDNQVKVRIGSVKCPSPDAKHQVFAGWQLAEGPDYYQTMDAEGNENTNNAPDGETGYYVTFGQLAFNNHNLDLYPVFKEARWLHFNTGKNAKYVGSAYRLTNDDNSGTYFDNQFFSADANKSARNGFTFTGWYINVNQNYSETSEITNQEGPGEVTLRVLDKDATTDSSVTNVRVTNGSGTESEGTATVPTDGEIELTVNLKAKKLVDADGTLADDFTQTVTYTLNGKEKTVKLLEVTGGKLYLYKALDELNLYAGWDEITATHIQVNVWRQNVNDDKDDKDADKTYDYVADYSYEVEAKSGMTLNGLREADKLHVNGVKTNDDVENLNKQGFQYVKTTMSTATVNADGKTVIEKTDTVTPDGNTVVDVYYDRKVITFNFNIKGTTEYQKATENTSVATEQYALINGEYVKLTPHGEIMTVWRPQYTYTAATGNETGPYYGLVDGEYVELTQQTQAVTAYRWKYEYYSNKDYYIDNASSDGVFYYWNEQNYTYTTNQQKTSKYTVANPPPLDDSTTYSSRGLNGSSTNYYFKLQPVQVETTVYTYTYDKNGTPTEYFGIPYTRANGGSIYTGTRYTNEDGTQYGIDSNGGYVPLTSGTETVYKWYAPVYGDVYKESTAMVEEMYGVDDNNNRVLLTPVKKTTTESVDVYKLTSTLTSGQQYLIVNSDEAGSGYALGHSETTIEKDDVTIKPATASSGAVYIRADNVEGTSVWKAGGSNNKWTFSNDGYYIWSDNNDLAITTATTDQQWSWNATYNNLKNNKYNRYLRCNDQGFSLSNQNDSKVYLYVKNTIQEEVTTITGYTYVDDDGKTVEYDLTKPRYTKGYGPTGETVEYTGTRWIVKNVDEGWHLYMQFTGLYGQTLAQNGYVWPESYDWDRDSSTNGARVTFLDAFLPTKDVTTVEFYSQTQSNGRTIIFYTQNLNPDGTPADTYTEANWVKTGSNSGDFNISDKYVGFTAFQYSADNGKWTGVGTKNNDTGYYGNAVSYNSKLEIHFNRNKSSITFRAQYPNIADLWPAGTAPQDSETVHDIAYGARIDSYADYWKPDVPPHYTFGGWYADAACTHPFDFKTTMPDNDLVVYAKWTPVQFLVELDPNGGEFGGPTDESTYFNQDYNTTIPEYPMDGRREFVEITETEAANTDWYYYLNAQYNADTDGATGLPPTLRQALYIKADQVDDYYGIYVARKESNPEYGSDTVPLAKEQWMYKYFEKDSNGNFQKYRALYEGETYTFLGWYKLDKDGNPEAMPYNFSDKVTEDITLRAYWRLDGRYRICYTPEYTMDDGTVINGEMLAWKDPQDDDAFYADGAKTNIYRQPDQITANGSLEAGENYIFRGWRLVSVKTVNGVKVYEPLEQNVYYDPGDAFTVQAGYADANSVIHFQAVYEKKEDSYRRPDVAALTLDANGGTLTNDGTTPSWDGGSVYLDHAKNQMIFGYYDDKDNHFQSNDTVHLYQYATTLEKDSAGKDLTSPGKNYFMPPTNGDLLIGFDDEQNEGDYIADYPADSVIAVQRTPGETIYAVWEPMVYLNIFNNTGGDKPLIISLSAAETSTLYIVNEATSMYDRVPVPDLNNIKIENGQTLRLAIPQGAGKDITISGTNNRGAGYLLTATSELNEVTRHLKGALTGANTDYTSVKNQKKFGFTDTLVPDPEGIVITFTAIQNPHTLVLDDNYPEPGVQTREVYFNKKEHEYDTQYDVVYGENATSYELPSTTTRIGYVFLGWDPDPEWMDKNPNYRTTGQTPKYGPPNKWRINNLTEFFKNETDPEKLDSVKTLYAVWDTSAEAQTVYIFKEVPEPGDQTKEFNFTVSLSGKYSYQEKDSEGNWQSKDDNDFAASFQNENSLPFQLKHGEYLKITCSQDNIAERPFIQAVIDKYNEDDQIVSTYTLSWTWEKKNDNSNYKFIGFHDFTYSVVEDDYSSKPDYYDTTLTRTALADSKNPLKLAGSDVTTAVGREVTWDSTDTGGNVVFTNTRKTVNVTLKKVLEGRSDAKNFNFHVHYTADNNRLNKDSDITVTSKTEGTVIEKVPVGAELTITEKGTDLLNYVTTVERDGTKLQVEESTTPGDTTTYQRKVEFKVTEATTVTFTNTLKSVPVKIVIVGSDGENTYYDVIALFSMSPGFSQRYSTPVNEDNNPRGNIIYETGAAYSGQTPDPELYVGEYTLTETYLWGNYICLDDTTTIRVVGTTDGAEVKVDGKSADVEKVNNVWVVTITNRRTVDITVQAVLEDPTIVQRKFDFTARYTLGKDTYKDSFALMPFSTSDGSVSGDRSSCTLAIPIGAKDLTIVEDNADDYDTWVQCRKEQNTAKNPYVFGDVAIGNDGDIITFYNRRRTDVYFKKIDGYGNPLEGAEFKLYKNYGCAESDLVQVTDDPEKNCAESTREFLTAADGTKYNVTFKVAPGVYYMKETVAPPGYEENDYIYRVVVGAAGSKVDGFNFPEGKEFMIECMSKATTTETIAEPTADPTTEPTTETLPDIATYGIMNISTAKRKVILDKILDTRVALPDAEFEIYRYDRTLVSSTDIDGKSTTTFKSGNGGVFWAGELPLGTYYIHETKLKDGTNPNLWWTLTIEKDGTFSFSDSAPPDPAMTEPAGTEPTSGA